MEASLTPILLLLLMVLCVDTTPSAEIRVKNSSEQMISLWWINPDNRQYVSQSDDPGIYPQSYVNINSFQTHRFAVVEETGDCVAKRLEGDEGVDPRTKRRFCYEGRFVVADATNQLFKAVGGGETFAVVSESEETKRGADIKAIIDDCVEAVKVAEVTLSTSGSTEKTSQAVISECIRSAFDDLVSDLHDSLISERSIRLDMADMIENYTCADFGLPSTEPKSKTKWRYTRKATSTGSPVTEPAREVHVHYEGPNSMIHVIKNFVSTEECDAVNRLAAPSLHRATVADSNGGSQFSENRKAMQSSVTVDYSSKDDGESPKTSPMTDMQLSARLGRRILAYTNDHTDFALGPDGQEDLMAIQYAGQGRNSPAPPDRYMPHCDGDCEGDVYREGSRVATSVIYCRTPDLGGATNFARVNVHVVPEVGDATFFTYVGKEGELPRRVAKEIGNETETKRMRMTDEGFTQHSGCPVYEGEKKIITMWMRMGVDNKNPWDSWNTMGVKKRDADKLLKKNKMKARKGAAKKSTLTSSSTSTTETETNVEEAQQSPSEAGLNLMRNLGEKFKSLF